MPMRRRPTRPGARMNRARRNASAPTISVAPTCSISKSARRRHAAGGDAAQVSGCQRPARHLVHLLSTDRRARPHSSPACARRRRAGGHASADFARRRSYELGDADELVVPLTWQRRSGVPSKSATASRAAATRSASSTTSPTAATPWRGAEYAQHQRRSREMERSMFDVDSYSFDGPIVYDGDKSEKLKRDDLLDDGHVRVQLADRLVGLHPASLPERSRASAGDRTSYEVQRAGDTSTSSAIARLVQSSPGASKTLRRRCSSAPSCSRSWKRSTKR